MYCGKCGAENIEENNYCTNCGSPLNNKNTNSHSENLKSNNNNNISTLWLDFITVAWVFVGIYNILNGLLNISNTSGEITISKIIFIIQGVIQIITWYFVHTRKDYGYYLFITTLFINAVSAIYSTIIQNIDELYFESYLIGSCIGALIWFIPNYIYIRKRKSLFNIEEDEW